MWPHAPVIWSSAICAPSWQIAHGDLCLAFVWLILFDLDWSCLILFDLVWLFPGFQKSCKNKHPKRVPEYMTFRLMTFLAIYKSYCKKSEMHWKIIPKSIKIHPNSIPNRPKWCPGALQKVSVKVGREKGAPSLRKGEHFGATWAILGAIWCPAGRQGGPKIKSFGIRMRQNLKK